MLAYLDQRLRSDSMYPALSGFYCQSGSRVVGGGVGCSTRDLNGRTIVACFHYTTEENWNVGYFYLLKSL
jgi:hypothetical protein